MKFGNQSREKDCKIHLSDSKKNIKMYHSVAGRNNKFFQLDDKGGGGRGIENFVSLSLDETPKFVDWSRNSPIRRGKYREILLKKGVRNVETVQFKICFLNSMYECSF